MSATEITTPVIDLGELRERLDAGEQLVLVEALPEMYWRKGHLPGAINIPHTEVDALAPALLPDRNAQIVVYCADLACPNSRIAAGALRALGYADVRVFAQGKQAWIEAGLPVERG